MIDFAHSESSGLTLFRKDPLEWKQIILPGNATVRVDGHEFFIPQGEERLIGPVGEFEYELISWAPTRWKPRRWFRRRQRR